LQTLKVFTYEVGVMTKASDGDRYAFTVDYSRGLIGFLSGLGFDVEQDMESGSLLIQAPIEAFVVHWSRSKVPDDLGAKAKELSELALRFGKNRAAILVTPLMLNDYERSFFRGQNIFFVGANPMLGRSGQAEVVADQIKTHLRMHSKFVGSETILGSDFITSLCRNLDSLGLKTKCEFKVPLGVPNMPELRVDIYINSPVRAFIELFSGSRVKKGRPSYTALAKAQTISKIFSAFEGQIIPILLTRGKLGEPARQSFAGQKIVFIDLEEEGSIEKIAAVAANRVKNALINSEWGKVANLKEKVENVEYLRPLEGLSQFGDILVSLRPLMTAEHFNLVLEEVQEFNEEFDSKHYTSATLRVGRTLEYVVYILAQSWGVKIDNASFKRLSALQSAMDQLKKHFIQYVYEEKSERNQKRKLVKDKIKNIHDQITDLAMNIDDDHEVTGQVIPVNIQTIIRDAGKKYARQEEIRRALEKLTSNPAIERLLLMRNRSAHANIDLQGKQFEENEILQMIADLKSVIFALCNISNAIANLEN
jgi:hypothetical protein